MGRGEGAQLQHSERALIGGRCLAASAPREELANKLCSAGIEKIDWSEWVECAYDRVTDDCQCGDGPCRCSTLEDVSVSWIRPHDPLSPAASAYAAVIDGYASARADHASPSQLRRELYAMERLLSRYVPTPDELQAETGPGLYGEEIERVNLWSSRAGCAVSAVDLSDDSATVEALLREEYGQLPRKLSGRSWGLREIPLDHVELPQREHAAQVESSPYMNAYRGRFSSKFDPFREPVMTRALDEGLPAGVATLSGGRARVCDGYHRLSAARAEGAESVWLWVSER